MEASLDLLSMEQIRELLHLMLTQFTPEGDDPQTPDDIMCCGKFKRCPLSDAYKIITKQEDRHEDQYPVLIPEGGTAHFVRLIVL